MESNNCLIEGLVPAEDASASLQWLKLIDGREMGVLENYEVEEEHSVDAETLAKVLSGEFYINPGDIMNTGVFSPLAKVDYIAANGKKVTVVYSLANAEAVLYADGEQVKSVLLYNPDNLFAILESI